MKLVHLVLALGILMVLGAGGIFVLQGGFQTPPPIAPEISDAGDESLEAAQERLERVINGDGDGDITDLQPRNVSPEVAAQSAAFAEAMRQRTGAVPDGQTPPDEQLVIPSNTRFKDVTPLYYDTWDDLMQRCWVSVSQNEPFNEAGLTSRGEDRVDYSVPYTRQMWFTVDKAFKVTYEMLSTYYADSGVARRCRVETNRFALVNSDAVALLKDEYDVLWGEEHQIDEVSTFIEYPYTMREGDQYHRVETNFGSVQGCPLIIGYSDLKIASERDATFDVGEQSNSECQAPAL
ncbi:hypothetical protein [Yoonia maritima]|uniref:hypothetical protein n=1 Tax=Yoonia maritima TaxID=1435347 RepID=UPI0013A64AC6|nr:hypothetical protein [Yoonia maritima]